jgi:2-polyprenyl-6-methoxyphenol hydroxylase-like FAD-dependent oxidoreductase
MNEAVDVDVLVVGAGPVGLTLAIDLAWRGVNVTVVETRAAAEPPEPKCNHVAARTMEIFRRLGLAEKVRNSGLPADYPHDISYRTTFTGQELTASRARTARIAIGRRQSRRIASTRSFSSPSCSNMPRPKGASASSAARRPRTSESAMHSPT